MVSHKEARVSPFYDINIAFSLNHPVHGLVELHPLKSNDGIFQVVLCPVLSLCRRKVLVGDGVAFAIYQEGVAGVVDTEAENLLFDGGDLDIYAHNTDDILPLGCEVSHHLRAADDQSLSRGIDVGRSPVYLVRGCLRSCVPSP